MCVCVNCYISIIALWSIVKSQQPRQPLQVAFEKARQLDPLCSETIWELSNVLEKNKQLNEAVEVIEGFLRHQVRTRTRACIRTRTRNVHVHIRTKLV